MKVRIVSAAVVAMLATTANAQAPANYCEKIAPDRFKLNFEADLSMVVHDGRLDEKNNLTDGVLDVTFEDVGISNPHGDLTDRLFSLGHTLGAILDSAGAPSMPSDQAAFLQTMIGSFDNDEKILINPSSGLLMPVDDRFEGFGVAAGGDAGRGEGSLSPRRLLGIDAPTTDKPDQEMRPLALFNRFDLAPADWKTCGEYRIVYGVPDSGIALQDRFLLIFEAGVPNPGFVAGNPDESRKGCRPMAEFWAALSDASMTKQAKAKALHDLYYLGNEKITGKYSAGSKQGQPKPIVSFENYGGGLAGAGQVRANMFFQGPWQLREWLTQLTLNPRTGRPAVAFVPETVKDNPVAELYMDDLDGTRFSEINIPSMANGLHRDFIEALVTKAPDHLFVERSGKFQQLVSDLEKFENAGTDADKLLVSLLALGLDDRFNEFQSVSNAAFQTDIDEPSKLAGPELRRLAEYLFRTPNVAEPSVPSGLAQQQKLDIMLNRAEAATCAGCHQTSARDGLTPNAAIVAVKSSPTGFLDTAVRWPDVAGGFVHVREDRQLSPALTEHFLPTRRYIMGRFLCDDRLNEPAVAAMQTIPRRESEEAVDLLLKSFVVVDRIETLGLNVADSSGTELLEQLPPETQEVAVEALRSEVMQARAAEQRMPGAFVEVRRPH